MSYKLPIYLFVGCYAFSQTLYGMEAQRSQTPNIRIFSMYTEKPLTRWLDSLYDKPFPGISFNYSIEKDFAALLEYAMLANQDEANTEEWSRVKEK